MVTPGEHPYLVTEAALNPRPNRERLAQFFFEGLGAPALHIALPAPLSLFACGRTSGLVLDIGDSVTTAVPVAQGHCDVHALQRLDFGGRDITDRMLTLLRKSGSSLLAGTSSEWQAVRRMKEKLGYVATNPAQEELRVHGSGVHGSVLQQQQQQQLQQHQGQQQQEGNGGDEKKNGNGHGEMFGSGRPTSFQLPDGNVIRVAAERFRAPEILFQPDIVGREFGGVQKTIAMAINNVDIGLRRSMYSNILLAVRYFFFFNHLLYPSFSFSLLSTTLIIIIVFSLQSETDLFRFFSVMAFRENDCAGHREGRRSSEGSGNDC